MNIHQIWIGDGISGQDAADVEDIRQKCEAAGHTHKLWSYDELIGITKSDTLKAAFKVAKKALPHTMFSSMATDYFRLYLLSMPGVYLDTDVVCTTDEFPEFPREFDIQMCTNTNGVTPNTCILHSSNKTGADGCAKAAEAVARKLEEEFLFNGSDHVAKLVGKLKAKAFSLIGFVGPSFFTKNIVPTLSARGVTVGLFDRQFASSSNPDSVLYHRGEGSWCKAGTGNYKDSMARSATKPRSVHQIWVGGAMPYKERLFTSGIESWCIHNNVQYTLWDESALREKYPDEPIWKLYSTLEDSWKGNKCRMYSMLSDYFRYMVLEPGGMYLDTDVRLDGDIKLDFNGTRLLAAGEFWDKNKACSGILAAQERCVKLTALRDMARARAGSVDPATALEDMSALLGPKWLRESCKTLGGDVFLGVLGDDLAGHGEWAEKPGWKNPPIVHIGSGSWVNAGKPARTAEVWGGMPREMYNI